VTAVVNTFLLVFAALFPIVNPLGSAPIFLSLTADCTSRDRNRLAFGVAFNGFFLLLGSLLFGSEILEFFGLTVPVVRVAGGLLVAAMGWRLLNEGNEPPERQDVKNEARSTTIGDSFYPLTLPLTVGPGSISLALTIGTRRPRRRYNGAPCAPCVRGRRRSARHCGNDLSVLPFRGAARRFSGERGHQCAGPTVGLHPDLHRDPDRLEWHQCTDRRVAALNSAGSSHNFYPLAARLNFIKKFHWEYYLAAETIETSSFAPKQSPALNPNNKIYANLVNATVVSVDSH
jgi:MarC family membrane protein